MKLLGKKLLYDFQEKHVDSRSQIDSWRMEIEEDRWDTPHDLKKRYPKASLVKKRQAVFDICRNKYRLLVRINYKNKIVLVRKIGTHKEYDNWNMN